MLDQPASPVTAADIVARAIRTLRQLQRLQKRLSEETIRRSVEATLPDPPAGHLDEDSYRAEWERLQARRREVVEAASR
jgi:hypothetical protein